MQIALWIGSMLSLQHEVSLPQLVRQIAVRLISQTLCLHRMDFMLRQLSEVLCTTLTWQGSMYSRCCKSVLTSKDGLRSAWSGMLSICLAKSKVEAVAVHASLAGDLLSGRCGDDCVICLLLICMLYTTLMCCTMLHAHTH